MSRKPPAKQAESGTKRTRRGTFAKGVSGNPHGRKPKALATVEKLRTALAKELPGIIKAVVKKAKDGDTGACKLILERVLPPFKPAEIPVFVDALTGSRVEQGEAILRAVAAGDVAPGQAAALLAALASQAKVFEVDELERRLLRIEEKLTDGKHTN